ncbi:hypothetical protein, partial [Microcoleus sp. B5-C4]|uniref:hypothetical protein n=1 Tax=Microcoleus sp. B5-C4 TaxID=2818675 RepID=UPI002FD280E3
CPFRNRLFGLFHKNVELLWNGHLARLGTGFSACSTKMLSYCGTGILPVLDKGATSQVKQIYSVISCRVNQAQFRLSPSKI